MNARLPALLLLVGGLPSMAQVAVLRYWSGGLTAHSITVNVQLSGPSDSLRLIAYDDPLFLSSVASSTVATDSTTWCMARLKLNGLQPGTAYRYRFEVNGSVDTAAAHTGAFRTPSTGPCDLHFAVGSCNQSSWHPVWQAMLAHDPLFFLSTGDLHYMDPCDTTMFMHRWALLAQVLDPDPSAAFLHRVPIAYMWDDHDFCGNGSDATFPCRYAAFRTYREFVPHHPLAFPADTMPIQHSFVLGRVRFILSDMRGTKTATQMMDSVQHAWLLHELVAAKLEGQLAVWVTSLSWNAIGYTENWGSAPLERQWLSDLLKEHDIRDVLIICGDAHMLAIDSGANGDFTSAGDNPWRYPVFQAAAINRGGSYKGGTYDQGGYFPNPSAAHGQFGMVHVLDDGTQVCVTLEGFRTDSMSATHAMINSYTFCRTPVTGGISDGHGSLPGLSCAWSSGQWTLAWPGAEGEGALQVLDGSGRLVRERRLVWLQGRCAIPDAPLAPGAYVFRAYQGGRSSMARIATW